MGSKVSVTAGSKTANRLLCGLFAVASAALTGVDLLHRSGVSKSTTFALNIVLLAFAGGGACGFVGVGLSVTAENAKPVSATYTGGMVEWWIQIFGAILAQV